MKTWPLFDFMRFLFFLCPYRCGLQAPAVAPLSQQCFLISHSRPWRGWLLPHNLQHGPPLLFFLDYHAGVFPFPPLSLRTLVNSSLNDERWWNLYFLDDLLSYGLKSTPALVLVSPSKIRINPSFSSSVLDRSSGFSGFFMFR